MPKTVSFLATVVLTIACGAPPQQRPITDAQRNELLAQFEAALARAKALEAQRAKGTVAFFAQPAAPNVRCAAPVIMRHDLGEPRSNRTPLMRRDKEWNATATTLAELPKVKGRRLQAVEQAAVLLRAQITRQGLPPSAEAFATQRGLQQGRARVQKLADPSWYRYDILYAETKVEQKLPYEGKLYPNFVQGRALVWDYQLGKVVCAGQAEANFYGTATVYRRHGQAATPQAMLDAVQHSLRDAVHRRALRQMCLGVDNC